MLCLGFDNFSLFGIKVISPNMNERMESLSPTDIGLYVCPDCDYKTTWNGDLATHLMSVHS